MKKRICTIISLVFILLCFSSCTGMIDILEHNVAKERILLAPWNDCMGTVLEDLCYSGGDLNRYELFIPADKSTEQSKHLLLYIHGGSWSGGDKAEGESICKYFCAKGYVTATMDYTLNDKKHTTSILKINDEVRTCVAAIKEKASELGIELESMAVGGFSAGACQALLYGFKEKGSSPLDIRFIFEQSGPVTFEPSFWTVDSGANETLLKLSGFDGTTEGVAKLLCRFSGQNVTPQMVDDGSYHAIADSLSPLTYMNSSSVPVLLGYGSLDGLVPKSHKWLLMDKLEEKGVHYDYVEFPNCGHNLIYDQNQFKLYLNTLEQYCTAYF